MPIILSKKAGGGGGSSAPSGPAGGSLTGTYPNPTIASGSITNAMLASDAPGWTVVRKTADESVASSTVLQADDELFFATVNLAVYEIELNVIYGSPVGGGTPDMKLSAGEDTSARGAAYIASFTTAGALQLTAFAFDNDLATTVGTDTVDRLVQVKGTYWAAGGTFQFLWAQNTSGINPTIVRAGSSLRYRRNQ